MAKENKRADHQGPHRQAFEKSRQYILHTQTVCGICGRPVDKSLKPPDPMAPVVDHIIPLALGGHPSDRANLQLAHATCNRQKGTKLQREARKSETPEIIPNNVLPWSRDWLSYRAGDDQ